jgi:hypothetical protein
MTVQEVVDKFGGVTQMSYTLHVTTACIYQWLKKSYVPDSVWQRIMDNSDIGILDLFGINEERRRKDGKGLG